MSQFDGLDEVVLDADALKKLQCNILRSTGRARSTQVFRRFADRDSFKAWLQNGCPTPSAATTDATSPDLVNVLFTVEGLKLLGVERSVMIGVASHLSAADVEALAAYLSQLKLTPAEEMANINRLRKTTAAAQ